MTGKLKAKGNIMLATKMESVLGVSYPFPPSRAPSGLREFLLNL